MNEVIAHGLTIFDRLNLPPYFRSGVALQHDRYQATEWGHCSRINNFGCLNQPLNYDLTGVVGGVLELAEFVGVASYLGQLASGTTLEDATFLDVKMPSDAGGSGGGLVVFRHPGLEHYQRLIEAARSRLADLELDYGVEKSKVDSVRSRLFGALRPYYQERDRLRLLIQYRKGSTRALAEIMRRITRTA